MNLFRCVLASGGTGTGGTIMVTCDESFAGLTITCTNNTDTYTQTCPSTSPYVVYFENLVPDTWTISGIISGTTYSSTVEIPSYYPTSLSAGFDYKTWVTAGGLDPTDYASLSDVFADEAAVRRLMLVHASADYLIDSVTDDITVIDDFVANDTAMKWLGLCDYVCDGLTAITGVEAKLMASTYWERYLKDHVPVMTSNTAPYGVASASSVFDSNNAAYKAFDPNTIYGWHASNGSTTGYLTYNFVVPTCVKKVYIKNSTYRVASSIIVQGSNDGSNFEDIQTLTVTDTSAGASADYDISNSKYYLYYRLNITASILVADVNAVGFVDVQFYGRALSVSVPVMTSNTAPYGEVLYSSSNADFPAWKCFDGNSSSSDYGSTASKVSGEGSYFGYSFTSPIRVKKFLYNRHNGSGDVKIKFQYSDDKITWQDCSEEITINNSDENKNFYVECNEQLPHKHWRAYLTYTSESLWFGFVTLQFYGVDYSEKEFEAGTTKKWIYDNGVMLEAFSAAITDGGTVTVGGDYIEVNRTNGSANCSVATNGQIDLTPYEDAFAIVEDVSGTFLYHLCVMSSRNAGVSAATAKVNVSTAGPAVKGRLDISAVDQSQYVGIYAGNVTKYRIKEAWLTA